MNNNIENPTTAFMCILRLCGMEKQDILQITALLKTTENMNRVVDRLETKDFKATPQETMKICAEVIKESKA